MEKSKRGQTQYSVWFIHIKSICHPLTPKKRTSAPSGTCVNLAPLDSCVTNVVISSVGVTQHKLWTDANAPVLCYCWHRARMLLTSRLLKIKKLAGHCSYLLSETEWPWSVRISSALSVFCISLHWTKQLWRLFTGMKKLFENNNQLFRPHRERILM